MEPEGPFGLAEAHAEAHAETVLIQLPADADYLAVIRSACANVATKAGCTLPEVADLRLAVDEACGLLLRHTVRDEQAGGSGIGDLSCQFILDGATLRVILSRAARDAAPPQNDEFGWTILSALVDDLQWRVDGPVVRVEMLKHLMAGERP